MTELQVIDASPEQRADIERIQDAFQSVKCGFLVSPDGQKFSVPEPLFRVLYQATEALIAGYQVIVAPVQRQLTTQEAADLLNVSRTYLVRLLDDGKIASGKVGRHRRVTFGNLMTYKKQRMVERREALQSLIHESEEAGLYD